MVKAAWHLSLKGEHFRWALLMIALTSSVISFASYLYYQQREKAELELIAVEEEHHVQIQASVLFDDLRHVAYTLTFLRDQVLQHGYGLKQSNSESYALDFYSFLNSNELYDQVRLLDNSGMEVARADYHSGKPALVEKDKLQNKGGKYYFRESIKLKENDIYISSLDLNMERGVVEFPYKPVIRFGMPLFDKQGNKLGILVINHLAQNMLDHFGSSGSPTRAVSMLLNEDGYWLSHNDKQKEWGFMFASRDKQTIANDDPELWQAVKAKESGQLFIQNALVSFETIHPFEQFSEMRRIHVAEETKQRSWKIISLYSADNIAMQLQSLKKRTATVYLFALLICVVFFLLLAGFRQRRAEFEALHRLNSRAMEAALGGIVITDATVDGNPLIYCNPAYESMTGYSFEALLARDCYQFHGGDVNQQGVVRLNDAISHGHSCQAVVRDCHHDGSTFWNSISISPLRNEQGNVTHFIAYNEDVTERVLAEERLKDYRRRLSMATEAGGIGIWDYDVSAKSLVWDERMFELYRVDPDCFDGSYDDWRNRIHVEDVIRVEAEFQKTIDEGVPFETEFRICRSDDSIRTIQAAALIQHDEAGKPDHMIGLNWDITDRKMADLERERLLTDLQNLSRRLINLREEEAISICRALHDDVGQMLTAIQVQTEISGASCQAFDCESAQKSIAQIRSITNKMIDVIRGHLRLIKPGHLNELGLFGALQEMCREWEACRPMKIELSIAPLPESLPEKVELCIFRIVQESLTNVVKYANASRVDIVLDVEGDDLHLKIVDNGCGFDVDQVSRGMGLIGIQERAHSLNGSVRITSSPGCGTTTDLLIPYEYIYMK